MESDLKFAFGDTFDESLPAEALRTKLARLNVEAARQKGELQSRDVSVETGNSEGYTLHLLGAPAFSHV